jgi:hypothetical protein
MRLNRQRIRDSSVGENNSSTILKIMSHDKTGHGPDGKVGIAFRELYRAMLFVSMDGY